MTSHQRQTAANLTGKVAIVTGGHTGLGLGTSLALANAGARVYIASRSESKFQRTQRDVCAENTAADVRFLHLDLADLASVKQAAEVFMEHEISLHLLINNAGVMCTPYGETKDGFETQIAVNYIGHYHLTALLLPTLLATAKTAPTGSVRIINVSSDGHTKLAPSQGIVFSDMNLKYGYSVWARYGHSKLANVLHAKALAKRYPDILALSVHPGTVKTNLSQGPLSSTPLYRFIKPLVELGAPGPRQGAANIVFAATSQSIDPVMSNGAYFLPVGKVAKPSKAAQDGKMADALWTWTENVLKEKGY